MNMDETLEHYSERQYKHSIHMKNITKGKKMNNFKKIGVTALAGSLAMVSANAIEYTMSGGMLTTYTQANSDTATITTDSGTGFGTATDLGFTANGELDNGFTVKYFMSVDTNAALANTSSQMTVGMGELGTLQLNNIAGSKANGIDDIIPAAYNETWDGLSASSTLNNGSFFGSHTGSGSIDYRIPAQEYSGVTVNASITFDPNAGVGAPAKAGVAASSAPTGMAYTLQLAHESGLEVGAGYETVETLSSAEGAEGVNTVTGYVKYAMGGISVAYQESFLDNESRNEEGVAVAVGIADKDKASKMMGVAYTSGDITVSYGESTVDISASSNVAKLETIKLQSLQAAYVMGAMTVSAAMSETDNSAGILNDKYSENTLAVSFAF